MAKVATYFLAIGATSIFVCFSFICFELYEVHYDKSQTVVTSSGLYEDLNSNLQVSRFLQTRIDSSQLLPPFPTPPKIRHEACEKQERGFAGLPTISMVIPYLHETEDRMRATIASVLVNTPAELLGEVLLIDDGNEAEWQFHDKLKEIHAKVKVHRNPKRLGLIKSKVIGAGLTSSPVIMFMEAHCIVTKNWLEPLLRQLLQAGPSHNTVVVPVLDVIPENNFSGYTEAVISAGGFDWGLTFTWEDLFQRNKSWKDPEPYPSPAMSGGVFAIWRDFWQHSGTYDEAMTGWGGENVEMSLRVWRCGGRIEMVPCSRIGHYFRSQFPYSFQNDALFINLRRVAEVWLDDYKGDFLKHVPGTNPAEIGDIQQRLKLKEDLKCKSMDWYLEHIYPELTETSSVWKEKRAAGNPQIKM